MVTLGGSGVARVRVGGGVGGWHVAVAGVCDGCGRVRQA